MFSQKADVVIIGGGVIGTSILYNLAKNKIDVVLVEEKDIASGTSSACEGIIFLQTKKPGIHLKMAMKSAEIFKSLEEELDYNIEYVSNGAMVVIPDQIQMKVMKKFIKEQAQNGLEVQLFDTEETLRIQPALSPQIHGSAFCPDDAQVNPILLAHGFVEGAKRCPNARVLTNTKVIGIEQKRQQVRAVLTNRGKIETNIVVNAAGIHAPEIGRMINIDIPIKPRRGQILVTERFPDIVRGVVCTSDYIACKYDSSVSPGSGAGLMVEPTVSGNYLIGSTREFVGFDCQVTSQAIECMAKNLISLIPAFKKVSVIRSFAGLRPYTGDGLPVLGRVEGVNGFIVAAGHEGDGIALSPITGKLISELIQSGQTCIPLNPFNLSRFSK